MKPVMHGREARLGLFMVLISLLLILWLIPGYVELYTLGMYAEPLLNPRSFPYLVSGFIGLLGIAMLFFSYWKPASEKTVSELPRDAKLRVLGVLAISTLYLWLITLFGYLLPTFLGTLLLLRIFGEQRWWLMILISAGSAGSLYFVFGRIFHMMMPRGSIDFFYGF
ncbi:MAG: tripartite tricarboxylate transporter TctB family protein [Desulfobulbaceae bacterium]|nr:tripartite tricarboxylate transporter TctB family protein [Desulfobulbaceae bacterium]